MKQPLLPYLILPYTRLELPGWGYLYSAMGGSSQHEEKWRAAPTRVIRGKLHGYTMPCDLSNWSERTTYFLGRFYELGTQLLMKQVLRPGDRFLDVGANIGMLTLTAAALVTETGCVDSFEPNPWCVERIEAMVRQNGLIQVHMHPFALSDSEDSFTLSVIGGHSGTGTLSRPMAEEEESVSQTIQIRSMVGDQAVMATTWPVRLIKIDVEGLEYRVLSGLTETLKTWCPIVVTEMIDYHLQRAGSSRRQIAEMMYRFGYQPYGLVTRRNWLDQKLRIVPITTPIEDAQFREFLWLRSTDESHMALSEFIHR